jgi:SSS family solute:Na+ symporter
LGRFIAGIFITIAMNGLDQNIMQKNLTCKNQKEAQKNIFWFSIAFFISTLFFLALGVLIYHYAFQNNIPIPAASDELYPLLALNHFGTIAGIVFMIGIIAAAFSSADSALTALTTSFCIDILNLTNKNGVNQEKVRFGVHIMFSFIMFGTIVLFDQINDRSVVSAVFKAAGFTYGPLLGLYVFGLSNKLMIRDKWVPAICILSPPASYVLDSNSSAWLGGYQFGFEILLINAAFTFIGLIIAVERRK